MVVDLLERNQMKGSIALGFKFKIGKYKVRIWKYGLEVGDNLGGRIYFFPWAKWSKNDSNIS